MATLFEDWRLLAPTKDFQDRIDQVPEGHRKVRSDEHFQQILVRVVNFWASTIDHNIPPPGDVTRVETFRFWTRFMPISRSPFPAGWDESQREFFDLVKSHFADLALAINPQERMMAGLGRDLILELGYKDPLANDKLAVFLGGSRFERYPGYLNSAYNVTEKAFICGSSF